jgi:DNA helicase-2/ATP-dependent DNA helicase PcrA
MTDKDSLQLFECNAEQNQAIQYAGNILLVIAGPGTGKTFTLVERLLSFSRRLKPRQHILAITFSNKAAQEMKERVSRRWPEYTANAFIGTFHAWCVNLLKEFSARTDLPADFEVRTPEEIGFYLEEVWPREKKKEIKELCENVASWKAVHWQDAEPIWVQEYNQCLRARGMIDFDDLLREAVRLLRQHPDVLKTVRARYPFVFIDEYQDINGVQHALLQLLVHGPTCLTAIGDPNQAIYGFRGANVEYFQQFVSDFPQARVINLKRNYRSADAIIEASGQVVASSQFDVPELVAQIYRKGSLVVHQASTERAEAEYVVHQIEKILGGTSHFSRDSQRVDHCAEASDISFSDIAVIYRLNLQRKSLEEALARSGMPYHILGAQSHYILDGFDHAVEKIRLMTMHASKGLEFKVVFIVGCEENLIPLHVEGLQCDHEEERRLFYVAMTRAQDRLYFTASAKRVLYGRFYQNQISPFLRTIDERLKKRDQPQRPNRRRSQTSQLDLFQ